MLKKVPLRVYTSWFIFVPVLWYKLCSLTTMSAHCVPLASYSDPFGWYDFCAFWTWQRDLDRDCRFDSMHYASVSVISLGLLENLYCLMTFYRNIKPPFLCTTPMLKNKICYHLYCFAVLECTASSPPQVAGRVDESTVPRLVGQDCGLEFYRRQLKKTF